MFIVYCEYADGSDHQETYEDKETALRAWRNLKSIPIVVAAFVNDEIVNIAEWIST